MTSFTDREKRILQLLAAGRAHKQIADELRISLSYVTTSLSKIYRRLGVINSPHAVKILMSEGSPILLERDTAILCMARRGKTSAEIAAEVGCSEELVRTSLRHAIEQLHRLLS